MMVHLLRCGGLCFALVLLVSCVPLPPGTAPAATVGPGAETAPAAGAIAASAHVYLDIFSGRSDEVGFSLSAGQAQQLVGLFSRLTPTDCGPVSGRLGYRGFLLAPAGSAMPDARWVRVFGQSVRFGDVGGTGSATCRSDPGREVERLLLAWARPHLDAGLYTTLAGEIEKLATPAARDKGYFSVRACSISCWN